MSFASLESYVEQLLQHVLFVSLSARLILLKAALLINIIIIIITLLLTSSDVVTSFFDFMCIVSYTCRYCDARCS